MIVSVIIIKNKNNRTVALFNEITRTVEVKRKKKTTFIAYHNGKFNVAHSQNIYKLR